MEKEFIGYSEALALKELGFDEPCCAYVYTGDTGNNIDRYEETKPSRAINFNHDSLCISQPLKQQAFRWLYQKLDIEKSVMPLDTESQQLLLKELIDKVSSKHLLV